MQFYHEPIIFDDIAAAGKLRLYVYGDMKNVNFRVLRI